MNIPKIKIALSYDKKVKKSELKQVKCADDSVEVLREIFDKDTFEWTEEVILLCLNNANKIIGYYKVSSGGIASTIIDPRVVFTIALNCGASAVIIAHNHPSGNLQPSEQDVRITEKIASAGKLLDIRVLDHLILTDSAYYSFAEETTIL
jgi:DNA repair protein RadC